ncbi:hypothetical protein [Rahnella sp. ChDrAdgB13]|uniref:hypothetical protein n=1 Tax=Rahnella sp. ChDrAdgB13 TaxID=1850581 RepID=UPI001AD88E73|nr:hypothetical protein [Rahnella sp. ChDrAdgB13]
MTPADIQVRHADTAALSAWLHGSAPLPGCPDAQRRVVVLQQTGRDDVPQRLWPVLAHFCALTPSRQPGVCLILTGNALRQRQRTWIQTPGPAPVNRLMLRLALAWLRRACPLPARLFRRRRRTPYADE